MGKNIQKIQDMLSGNHKKIQVGYGDQEVKHRQVGDRWTDSEGIEWEQKDGFYTKVRTMPDVGIFSKVNLWIIAMVIKISYSSSIIE